MYKVLIVDDMEIGRIQLKRLNSWGESSGFQIFEEARNGDEAYTKLQKSPVDLIITDIRMPVLDGVELLEKVMTKKLAYCVVLLSEHSEFEYARKGLKLGAFDYITKPINGNDLAKVLTRAKEFITQRKLEEKRFKRNPFTDMSQVFELIKYGHETSKVAGVIFDKVTETESEMLTAQLLIQKLLDEIIELVDEEMPWIRKFVDINSLQIKGFSELNCKEKFKDVFITNINFLRNMVNALYLGSQYGCLINKISTFILENIDREMSLSIIAEHLLMNKNYLSEVFKEKTGNSLLDYITKVKMERGKKLLLDGELKSYEIADKLGYKDSEYFSKLFKKYYGMSPKEYKLNF